MTVSRVGVATGGLTCTVPAHNVGDVIIIFAFRSGSTTAPVLPAGFVNILTKSGTLCSARLGYKIATTTSDTSGSWTTSTNIVCHVYRAGSYATGGSLYIGGSASSSSTTNTVTYPALTMTHGDSTSWGVGFAGVSNLTETINTAPSGMTNESSLVGGTASVAGHDTNGVISSWSSTNATTTGTAGNSVSCMLELIENQPGTAISNFVQHLSYSYANLDSSGDTIDNNVYNFDPSLAGNGFVLAVAYPSGVTPAITDNKSNTWPAVGSANCITADDGAGKMALSVFVLASATTGTSQITVGFGGSPQGAVKVWITQLYNVTATINTSAHAAGVNATGGGVVSPGSITPGVANCLILSYMCDANINANVVTVPALIVPESNYSLNDADISFSSGVGGISNASQFQLQTTATATTPRFYLNAGSVEPYNVVAIALTTGSQGTAKPSGPGVAPWVDRICYFGASAGSSPTKWLLQIPSTGNCGLFVSHLQDSGTPNWVGGILDSDGTSWTFKNPTAGASSGYVNTGQTPKSNRTATITINAVNQNLQVIYYDISNCAATSPVVANVSVASTGVNNLNSAANQPSITPTATNQLTVSYMQIGLGPSTAVTTPSGAIYDLPSATEWSGTGSISATTFTVATTTWGTIAANQILAGAGVSAGTSIQSGTGPFTINPSQTVTPAEAMTTGLTDSNTIAWGNAAGHYLNGASTATQNWTYSIANQPSNSVSGFAIIFKGPAASSTSAGINITQESPFHPYSRMGAGVQGPNVAAPPQIGRLLVTQELPFHPGPIFRSAVIPGNVAAPPQIGGINVSQEIPFRPSSVVGSSVIGVVSAAVQSGINITQEQPSHPLPFVKPRYIVSDVAQEIADFFFTRQEQPSHPNSQIRVGIQGPNVAAPPQIGSVVLRQEQPSHPNSSFVKSQYIVSDVAQEIVDFYFTRQELPAHPSAQARAGVQGPNVAALPQIGSISVKQESPFHPASLLNPAVISAPVPSQISGIKITQEQPFHPSSRFTQAVIPGNVAAPPQIGGIKVVQEQPYHPSSFVKSQYIVSDVAQEITDFYFTRQEQPFHPLPCVSAILPPPAISTMGTPETRSFIIKQELPYHPYPQARAGVQGPNVAAPPQIGSIRITQEIPYHPPSFVKPRYIVSDVSQEITDFFFTRQEQPSHPSPRLNVGIQGPNVAAPPQIGGVKVIQEYPWHPISYLSAILPPPAVATTGTPETRSLLTRQETPYHPLPQIRASIQGPNVAVLPQVGGIKVVQEAPYHPSSLFRSAIIPGNVATLPQVGGLVTIQEVPYHPRSLLNPAIISAAPSPQAGGINVTQESPFHPSSFIKSQYIISDVSQEITDFFFTRQEQPSHLSPQVKVGVQGPNVAAPPQIGSINVTQEIPYHPPSFVKPRFTLPTVAQPQGKVVTTQEIPFHPPPRLGGAVIPGNVAALPQVGRLVTVQELPFHPKSKLWPAIIPGVVGPPFIGNLVTIQEYPWHPSPSMSSGWQPGFMVPAPNLARILANSMVRVRIIKNAEVRVRTLQNDDERVRILTNLNPRTTRH